MELQILWVRCQSIYDSWSLFGSCLINMNEMKKTIFIILIKSFLQKNALDKKKADDKKPERVNYYKMDHMYWYVNKINKANTYPSNPVVRLLRIYCNRKYNFCSEWNFPLMSSIINAIKFNTMIILNAG